MSSETFCVSLFTLVLGGKLPLERFYSRRSISLSTNTMTPRFTERTHPVVRKAAAFANEVVVRKARIWERERGISSEDYQTAGKMELCRLLVPPELGGLGVSTGELAEVMATLAALDLGSAFSLIVQNNLAGNIARNGTKSQHARFLPGLLRGERVGAFLLTEPQGGSDAGALTTLAIRAEGGWRISGTKAWVTNGRFADLLSVYVQTDPQAGHRGIACFLVNGGSEGVSRAPPYELLHGHALGTCAIRFDNCWVSDADMLLPPGTAFKAAMSGIDLARISVAAMCCGMLGDALTAALDISIERQAFGRVLAEFQGLQWMLADAATDLNAAVLLTREAIERLDRGEDASLAAAHAKKFATRVCFQRLSDCMQAMGADGLVQDRRIVSHLAGAKMAQYLDGTTEIQNVVIARRLISQARKRQSIEESVSTLSSLPHHD